MKARFPIGLEFERKRFPKSATTTPHRIDDILTTYSTRTGEIVRIEYKVSHEFMGQRISENVVDPTIARSLNPIVLALYL